MSRRTAALLAAVVLAAPGVTIGYGSEAPQGAPTSATQAEPTFSYPRTSTLARIYPDLLRAAQREPRFKWVRFELRAHSRWREKHPAQVAAVRRRVLRWEQTIPARELGHRIAVEEYGWSEEEFSALDRIWTQESGWRAIWQHGGGPACHIPQAEPCSKIPGGINATNRVAIEWGLNYVVGRYGSIWNALAHKRAKGWY